MRNTISTLWSPRKAFTSALTGVMLNFSWGIHDALAYTPDKCNIADKTIIKTPKQYTFLQKDEYGERYRKSMENIWINELDFFTVFFAGEFHDTASELWLLKDEIPENIAYIWSVWISKLQKLVGQKQDGVITAELLGQVYEQYYIYNTPRLDAMRQSKLRLYLMNDGEINFLINGAPRNENLCEEIEKWNTSFIYFPFPELSLEYTPES